VLPILACFAGSVAYHTLMANHAHYRRWLLIDVRPCRSARQALLGAAGALGMQQMAKHALRPLFLRPSLPA
jgi:hypothetical protein